MDYGTKDLKIKLFNNIMILLLGGVKTFVTNYSYDSPIKEICEREIGFMVFSASVQKLTI